VIGKQVCQILKQQYCIIAWNMRTRIIAHRGYSQKYPENTLISLKKAKELRADGIELDVHATSDSKLVIAHDYSLEKMSKKQGYIFEQSFEKIKKLDAGSWFNEAFREERIPTLQQVFDVIGKDMHYEIELKGFTINFINQVVSLAKERNLLNNIEFTSPHVSLLFRLKSLYPQAKIGLFVAPFPSWMDKELGHTLLLNNLKLGMFDVAHCPLSMINSALINLLRHNSILIHTADCNSKEELKSAYQLGVDQLSTNNLETALKLRDEII
jgi:glycerophosphoryl diester phosphodiesterase